MWKEINVEGENWKNGTNPKEFRKIAIIKERVRMKDRMEDQEKKEGTDLKNLREKTEVDNLLPTGSKQQV